MSNKKFIREQLGLNINIRKSLGLDVPLKKRFSQTKQINPPGDFEKIFISIDETINNTYIWQQKIDNLVNKDMPIVDCNIAVTQIKGLSDHLKLIYKHYRKTLHELRQSYEEQNRMIQEIEMLKSPINN